MTRILIVEDEVSFSDPLSYLLSKEGYEVSVAENGHDALTAFDATGADQGRGIERGPQRLPAEATRLLG